MSDVQAPMGAPGDIVNWPMLKVHYRTDPEAIAALLPPGITVGKEPNVNLTVYNFPVPDVPEYGVVTTVNADFDGVEGEFTLGYGIDQESAIFISQETNGQPKYPCEIDFHRLGPMVRAKCTHQGYTFLEFDGMSEGPTDPGDEFVQNEWWIKVSRAVSIGGPATGYDFPPHVVHVASKLPMLEQLSAYLWWPTFLDRSVTLSKPLDPEAFLPFADTISGSRWPGVNGAPGK